MAWTVVHFAPVESTSLTGKVTKCSQKIRKRQFSYKSSIWHETCVEKKGGRRIREILGDGTVESVRFRSQRQERRRAEARALSSNC